MKLLWGEIPHWKESLTGFRGYYIVPGYKMLFYVEEANGTHLRITRNNEGVSEGRTEFTL